MGLALSSRERTIHRRRSRPRLRPGNGIGQALGEWRHRCAEIQHRAVAERNRLSRRSARHEGAGLAVQSPVRSGNTRRVRDSFEIYSSARYFTITGKHVAGTPVEIKTVSNFVLARVLSDLEAKLPKRPNNRAMSPRGSAPVSVDDVELLRRRMFNSRNAAEIICLYHGHADHASPSDANIALCGRIAFWPAATPRKWIRSFEPARLCATSGILAAATQQMEPSRSPEPSPTVGRRTVLVAGSTLRPRRAGSLADNRRPPCWQSGGQNVKAKTYFALVTKAAVIIVRQKRSIQICSAIARRTVKRDRYCEPCAANVNLAQRTWNRLNILERYRRTWSRLSDFARRAPMRQPQKAR
jgi:hypothetical protein